MLSRVAAVHDAAPRDAALSTPPGRVVAKVQRIKVLLHSPQPGSPRSTRRTFRTRFHSGSHWSSSFPNCTTLTPNLADGDHPRSYRTWSLPRSGVLSIIVQKGDNLSVYQQQQQQQHVLLILLMTTRADQSVHVTSRQGLVMHQRTGLLMAQNCL